MRRWRFPLLLTAVVLAGVLTWHWLPARQVRLHQKHLLKAVESRNWKRVGAFVAADYHDHWGQTRDVALARLPQVFQDYIAMGILAEETGLNRDGLSTLVLGEKLKFVGNGGPIAQYIMQTAENLHEPFAFTWKRQSWKPWDWALVSVDQPEIELPSEDFY